MKARKSYFNFKLQQRSHTMTDINPNEVQIIQIVRIHESKPIIFSDISEYFYGRIDHKGPKVKYKMALLSRILILLAILLYEQYTHHTQASLRPNTQYLSAQQYAYQSFLSYFLILFRLRPSGMLGEF